MVKTRGNLNNWGEGHGDGFSELALGSRWSNAEGLRSQSQRAKRHGDVSVRAGAKTKAI